MTVPRGPWVPDEPNTANIVPPPEPVSRVELERAQEDTLIERSELGPDAAILIQAGDPIPAHLTARQRRPAIPKTTGRASRK